MLVYNLKLGLINLKRNPLLFLLVILTLSIGSGIFASNLAIYYSMAGDPYSQKSDHMYHISMNTWQGGRPHEEPFYILRYPDTQQILASDIPAQTVVSYQSGVYARDAKSESLDRKQAVMRATTPDFFKFFETPFAYGQGFSSDKGSDVVIGHKLNQQLFGGKNSVGEHLEVEGDEYRIVGVLKPWLLRPRAHHVTEDQGYNDTEDLFFPLETAIDNNFPIWGRSSSSDNWTTMAETRTANSFYLQAWVLLETSEQVTAFQGYLDSYTQGLREAGQHPNKVINQLDALPDWLVKQQVVDKRITAFAIASSLFLLVCAFNASSLLLSKIHSQQFENSLRRAVGASKWQVMGQGLSEGMIIGLLSCVLSFALAWFFLAISKKLLPILENLAVLDLKVGVSLVFITFVVSLFSALYPAIRSSHFTLANELK